MSDRSKRRYEKMITLCEIILDDLSRPTTDVLDRELHDALTKVQLVVMKMEKKINETT